MAGSAINALDDEERDQLREPDDQEEQFGTRSVSERLAQAWHHGFVTMLRDLAPWLLIGLVLAAGIGAALPAGWIAENIGTGFWPKIAMLFVGVPLYICATASTPFAWALVAAGLSPGAAIVLLLAGPATNVATMTWVIKDLGVKSLVVYVVTISLIALGAGVLFDAFFANTVTIAPAAESQVHGGGVWGLAQSMSAGAFAAALAWAVVTRYAPRGADSGAGGSCCSSDPGDTSASCCGSGPSDVQLTIGSCCGSAAPEPPSGSCFGNDHA
ncbi:MAG: permease [Planctomycetota bacterium]